MARNKANSKKKTQIITGTPIYRLLCNLFNEYVRIIKNNMQKDMKLTLGHKLIEHLSNTMLVFKKAYNIKDCIVDIAGVKLYQFISTDISSVVESIKNSTGIEIYGIIGFTQIDMVEMKIDIDNKVIKIGY